MAVGWSLPMQNSLEKTYRRLGESSVLAWRGRKLALARPAAPEVRGDRTAFRAASRGPRVFFYLDPSALVRRYVAERDRRT
jgi:hypothetical protein